MSAAAGARADISSRITRDERGEWVQAQVLPGDSVPTDVAIENYDNWRGSFQGGRTEFDFDLPVGGDEVGDDLSLADYHGGILDSVGWCYTNLSSGEIMSDFSLALRFYDASDLSRLGTFQFRVRGLLVGPHQRMRTFFDEGELRFLGMPLRDGVYMTVQFSDVLGVPLEDVGLPYGGPINTGGSTRYVRDFTAQQLVDLGESPQANLGFFVKTVPSPGAAALLSLAVLLGPRRRRLA